MPLLSKMLLRELISFRRERDWEQFHTPKNLSAALAIEAAELVECFLWARDEQLADIVSRNRESIEDEIADVAILLSYLCSDLGVDVNRAVRRKLRKNEAKYPAEVFRSNASKYNQL